MTIGSSLCALAAASFRDLPDLVVLLTPSFNFASVTCAVFFFFLFFSLSLFFFLLHDVFFIYVHCTGLIAVLFNFLAANLFLFLSALLDRLLLSAIRVCLTRLALFFFFFLSSARHSARLLSLGFWFSVETSESPSRRPFASSFPKFFWITNRSPLSLSLSFCVC